MKLLAATVRHYRVHGDVTVQFDGERTLIGGPNECGKSTLIEAIHRALFLKATVTGEALESMGSDLGGRPEVEVRFEARGAEYQLIKRFSGQTGTARLAQVGGQTWQGEEAESRLARLLGVDEIGGGKGILDRVRKQWAHLWVWQGESSDDLSESVEAQQAGLLRRLQQVGGAVAMQSELDDRVASLFSQNRSQIFGKAAGGAALKNSELGQAQAEVAQAEAARNAAAERVERLRRAMDDYEEASSALSGAASGLGSITGEQQAVTEKLSQVAQLRRDAEKQAQDVATAGDRLATLEGVEKNLAELREAKAGAQKALEPAEEEQRLRESRLADVRASLGEAQEAYEQALEKTRAAQLQAGLADAHVTRFKREARRLELTGRLERVQGLQKELDQIRAQSAPLVPIDQPGLEALQALDSKLAQASAALNAMAAEMEVVATDRAVLVGTTPLSAGQRQTVSDTTEVTVGDSVRLRIHPGGGDSLSRAREEARTLQGDLRKALDRYGLASISAAAEVVARRADLQAKADAKEAALKEWDAADLEALSKEADEEWAAINAEVRRREEQLAAAEAPGALAEAEALLGRAQTAHQSAESEEKAQKAKLDALREQLTERENERNLARETIEGERKRYTELSAQVELLLQNHGADDIRAQAVEAGRNTKAKLGAELAKTRGALEALQPELLEADKDRLQRAWKEKDDQRQEAEKALAVSRFTLRSDGADDPHAGLAQAEARLEAAGEHLAAVDRKARAIALVDDLFQEEQRALADQFSKPLADKIDSYLQSVFGPEAKTSLEFEDNHFRGVRLARGARAGAMPFAKLSEGAREQVAAAVRLAIAELLAADHDGSLPVVFDDAFTNSDPERVSALQRMLDLGAARGLQVIVLTCNPSDYTGLGAREVALPKPATP